MPYGLDDETVITGEIEERPRFPRRSELGEDVLGSEGKKVVCRVEVEVVFPKFAKDPRGVIFELEIVSRRGCQFVADDIKGELMASGEVIIGQRPFDLGLGSRYSNADACEHVVHQNIVYVTLANQVSDEHAWHLLGLLDTLGQTLAPDLFGLLLNVNDKLLREFAIVQSKVEVACCAGHGWRLARGRTSGVTSRGSYGGYRWRLEEAIGR
jgi:hypothetical protein